MARWHILLWFRYPNVVDNQFRFPIPCSSVVFSFWSKFPFTKNPFLEILAISVTHCILVTWWLITGVTICHSVWDKMGHNWESKQYLPIIVIASCTILSQLCCTHNISFRCAFPTANVCIILLFSVDRRLFRWSMVVLIWLAGGYLIIF